MNKSSTKLKSIIFQINVIKFIFIKKLGIFFINSKKIVIVKNLVQNKIINRDSFNLAFRSVRVRCWQMQ
jgi:hypothetical protein